MSLPEVTAKPCNDCPWRRNSLPGWLGPFNAGEWLLLAHGEAAIACHLTIADSDEDGNGDWNQPGMRQCAGAAIFRANICKSPRNPEIARLPQDRENVFSWNDEFIAHHER